MAGFQGQREAGPYSSLLAPSPAAEHPLPALGLRPELHCPMARRCSPWRPVEPTVAVAGWWQGSPCGPCVCMAFWAQATGPGVQGSRAVPLYPSVTALGAWLLWVALGLAPAWAGFSEPCWAVNKPASTRLSPVHVPRLVPKSADWQKVPLQRGGNGGDKGDQTLSGHRRTAKDRPSEALRCAWLLAVLAAGAEGETWSLQPRHPLHCSAGGRDLA